MHGFKGLGFMGQSAAFQVLRNRGGCIVDGINAES